MPSEPGLAPKQAASFGVNCSRYDAHTPATVPPHPSSLPSLNRPTASLLHGRVSPGNGSRSPGLSAQSLGPQLPQSTQPSIAMSLGHSEDLHGVSFQPPLGRVPPNTASDHRAWERVQVPRVQAVTSAQHGGGGRRRGGGHRAPEPAPGAQQQAAPAAAARGPQVTPPRGAPSTRIAPPPPQRPGTPQLPATKIGMISSRTAHPRLPGPGSRELTESRQRGAPGGLRGGRARRGAGMRECAARGGAPGPGPLRLWRKSVCPPETRSTSGPGAPGRGGLQPARPSAAASTRSPERIAPPRTPQCQHCTARGRGLRRRPAWTSKGQVPLALRSPSPAPPHAGPPRPPAPALPWQREEGAGEDPDPGGAEGERRAGGERERPAPRCRRQLHSGAGDAGGRAEAGPRGVPSPGRPRAPRTRPPRGDPGGELGAAAGSGRRGPRARARARVFPQPRNGLPWMKCTHCHYCPRGTKFSPHCGKVGGAVGLTADHYAARSTESGPARPSALPSFPRRRPRFPRTPPHVRAGQERGARPGVRPPSPRAAGPGPAVER
nr:basic proline-rich protein-like [Dasypus novemcinctus]